MTKGAFLKLRKIKTRKEINLKFSISCLDIGGHYTQALITFDERKLYYFAIYDTVYYENEITDNVDTDIDVIEDAEETQKLFDGYIELDVDYCSLSGFRESNVVVDVGFGDREYWAFTNDYGQLVKVIANEIILQDDENEAVLSTGRYCSDEAKVL